MGEGGREGGDLWLSFPLSKFLPLSVSVCVFQVTEVTEVRPPSSPHCYPRLLLPPAVFSPVSNSMDLKDSRHRSLTSARCSKESQFHTSSLDADERRVPTQKSYSSSETLKAFDHEQRLHYGGCVTDLVHHEADEFSRPGGFVSTLVD